MGSSIKLSEGKRWNYTDRERRFFAALPRSGSPISSSKLAEIVYADMSTQPFYARNSVLGVGKMLARKVMENRESFRITQSERAGPRPCFFWIEEKK